MSAKRGATPTLRDQLYKAAEDGDAAMVRSLLGQGVPVGIKNTRWMTPLHLATQGGHTEAVQALLEGGAQLDSKDRRCRTPLLLAVSEGHVEVVSVLLAAGADPIACCNKGDNALSVAIKKGHSQVVEALAAAGADINYSSPLGVTALHQAARKGNRGIIDALVSLGADLAAVDSEGKTPLAWAAQAGRTEVLQKLLEHGSPLDAPALAAAAAAGRTRPLEVLLSAVRSLPSLQNAESALGAAASHCRLKNLSALLAAGLPVDAGDSDGKTALMHAAGSRSDLAHKAIEAIFVAGASLEARDNKGRTALMLAAQTRSAQFNCSPDIIQTLARAGANLDARDSQRRTALHYAIGEYAWGDGSACKALLEAGADVNAADSNGVMPLLAAIKAGHKSAASLIIRSGRADMNAADMCGNLPAFLAACKGMGSVEAELQSRGAQGAPSGVLKKFFRSAAHGDLETVLELAAASPPDGVDINTLGGAGVHCTHLLAMFWATRSNFWGWERWEWAAKHIRSLQAAGADVAAASETCPTPLDLMLFEKHLQWRSWADTSAAFVMFTRELAAAGCPVDTRLPGRVGDGSLQPSTLETWLARLAQHGWPTSQDAADRALAVSRTLLECAAAQGSQGRPELVAAAEAVGSPELLAAVREVLPLDSPGVSKPRARASGGNRRRAGRGKNTPPSAAAPRRNPIATVGHLVTRPLLPAAPLRAHLSWGRVARTRLVRVWPSLCARAPSARLAF